MAIELEFMSRLLARGSAKEAKAFFAEHLDRWVFRCLEQVAEKTISSFYRVVADCLATFLRRERSYLK